MMTSSRHEDPPHSESESDSDSESNFESNFESKFDVVGANEDDSDQDQEEEGGDAPIADACEGGRWRWIRRRTTGELACAGVIVLLAAILLFVAFGGGGGGASKRPARGRSWSMMATAPARVVGASAPSAVRGSAVLEV